MHEKRMAILRLLYEKRKKSMGPILAAHLHAELSEEIPEFNEFMSHLFYWVEKGYVYRIEHAHQPVRIEAPGIDYYEYKIKPWYKKALEAIVTYENLARFFYTTAGILLGAIIGYLLGKS